jgi:hypothetical protein
MPQGPKPTTSGPRTLLREEVRGRVADEAVARVGRRLQVRDRRVGRQHRGLVAHLAVDRVDQEDRALLARIVGAPEHGECEQVRFGDAQAAHDGRTQRVLGWSRGSRSSVILSMGPECKTPPGGGALQSAGAQPPLCGRLPGFFLLRVCEPRSRLIFWPWPVVLVTPFGALGRGVALCDPLR